MAEMPDRLGMVPCAVGAFAAIAAVAFLFFEHGVPLFMASQGASAVILFSMPDSAATRPRNVIAGHLMSAAIGVALVHILGPTWFATATAVTSSIVLMAVTRITHPPGGGRNGADRGHILCDMGFRHSTRRAGCGGPRRGHRIHVEGPGPQGCQGHVRDQMTVSGWILYL
ncbi:MAG: HPP family protein [Candidatus Methanomethylophilaceae archaeon]|nr:HPP family protein [Candidatus Methanomethylophilaceae archaeon]